MTSQLDISAPSRRAVLAAIGGGTLALCLGGCAAGQPQAAPTPVSVPVADVPIGAGIIVGQYVVTQPTQGKFVAFSYLCPHQDLPVQEVTDQAINCVRHGATFSLADGAVIAGPADRPLTPAPVVRVADLLTVG